MINYLKKLYNPWTQNIFYFLILVFLFFYLGLDNVFFMGPKGIHFMRQTDSLSFASNYFNFDFNFFKPQLYNLKNIEGKAICEFPITYYLTALLYQIFGKQFFIQRLLHLLIAYFGAFCFFKLAHSVLKDYTYALIIGTIIFTSTVFNYYSFNYLPDMPALGLCLAGGFFIYKHQKLQTNKALLIGYILLTIGSLIKVTYTIYPIGIAGLSLVSILFFKRAPLVQNQKKVILYGLVSVAIVATWNLYIIYYNSIYDSHSFNTKALPIWNINHEKILYVWDICTNYWYRQYLPKTIFRFIYAAFFFQLIFIKKGNLNLLILLGILFIGNLSYFILFYSQFIDHDYYFLVFFPLILLLLISAFKTLQNISQNVFLHTIVKAVFIIVIISGINFSKPRVYKRFSAKIDKYSQAGLIIQQNQNEINNLKLDFGSKFIIAPDYCQNGGLFFLDKKGWNLTPDQISVKNINELKDKGANYLLLISEDPEVIAKGDSTGTNIFKGKELSIFELNP